MTTLFIFLGSLVVLVMLGLLVSSFYYYKSRKPKIKANVPGSLVEEPECDKPHGDC